MSISLQVSEAELTEVLAWAQENIDKRETEFEDGTYEEGLVDGIRWALGMILTRPGS